jgi:acetyl esterase/lipase
MLGRGPLFFVCLLAVACGNAETTGGDLPSGEPPPAPTGAAAPPPAGTSGPGEPAPVGTPPAATSRARCGAAAYEWVKSATLGDVLEQRSLASHTPVELTLTVVEARNQNAFKTRRVPKHGTKARVVRYQTQDKGALVEAPAAVAYPNATGTFPVMLVLHGTAGFNDTCSPSGGIPDDVLGSFTDGSAVFFSLLASLGYIVVAPDYLGLKSMGAPSPSLHPYLVGEPTAIASLDAVRAVKKLLATATATPGDLVVMGGSQGGHAAAFVNRYQPHYAPELAIKGSVWDVPPTDLLAHTKRALTSWQNATKNVIGASIAMESWYRASPNGYSGAFLAPYDATLPQALASSCSPAPSVLPATPQTSLLFTPSLLSLSSAVGSGNAPPWSCYFSENSLPTTSVPKLDDVPSLFLVGENDELVDTAVERESFQKLCQTGHELSYLECQGASHTKPLTYAFDQWIDFLEDRLTGKPLTGTCTVRPAEKCTSTP